MGADTGGRYDATSIPEQDRPPSLPMPGWLSAFKKIWVDAWSARMEYILGNIMLALLERH